MGWDFPIGLTVGGSTQAAPAKGQGQKSSFQSLPGSGLAKLLLSISGFRNGWCGLRYSVPTRTRWAYSWTTREMIELD